ncbi:hypothetical protein [Galbibacter sp.]|uniref:hypothetical protein n=1 Tax=Galbibacter sp. TaxID=2918471 RepID=UPI003A943C8B
MIINPLTVDYENFKIYIAENFDLSPEKVQELFNPSFAQEKRSSSYPSCKGVLNDLSIPMLQRPFEIALFAVLQNQRLDFPGSLKAVNQTL